MPTFVLKKYADPKTQEQPQPAQDEPPQEQNTPVTKTPQKEIMIEVSGSVASIVAHALNKTLVRKDVTVDEVTETSGDVKAISTEDIANNPVETLRKVRDSKLLFIATEGFKTKKEEWFLTNLEGRVGQVFYSVEAFVDYLKKELSDAG